MHSLKFFSLPESINSDLFLHFIQIDILSEKHDSFKIILKTTFPLALARWFSWVEHYPNNKVVGSIFSQGTHRKQPVNAYISGTTNQCLCVCVCLSLSLSPPTSHKINTFKEHIPCKHLSWKFCIQSILLRSSFDFLIIPHLFYLTS